jgi:hypothetical protein
MSHLHLQWTYRKATCSGGTSRYCQHPCILVRIPKDLHALGVRLQQPYRSQRRPFSCAISTENLIVVLVELDTSSKLLVILSTGRNQVSQASLKLSAPSSIHFKYHEAVLDGNSETWWHRIFAERHLFIMLFHYRWGEVGERRWLYMPSGHTEEQKHCCSATTFWCICLSCHSPSAYMLPGRFTHWFIVHYRKSILMSNT